MYLSRVEIPWRSAANSYNLHRVIWDLFPGQEKEKRKNAEENRSGFLFRIEKNNPGQKASLLIQSNIKPASESQRVIIVGSKEFNPAPISGQHLAFLLTANPVKTIADEKGRTRKKDNKIKQCRVPLIKEQQQIEWLARRLENVAKFITVSAHKEAPIFFHKRKNGEIYNGKLVPITFEGILEVGDADEFLRKMQNGIGPAKAFGCGLLLVRRI